MTRRSRTFYRLTSEGRTLWSRRANIELPENYRRILGLVESCGHKAVIRSQLARYPDDVVDGWLKEFETLNLIELTWIDSPGALELGAKAAPLPLDDDDKLRISIDARLADVSLSRLGVYVDHQRVVNRAPNRKAPRSTWALVVEDDPDQLALAVLRLTKAGYRVQTAESVNALLESLQKSTPDAMFLDVMLPDGDGFEMLSALRQHPSYALMPIIMVTAKTEAENVARGLALGADAYVTKPYGSNALEYALRYVLQQELPDVATAPAPKAEEKSVPAATPATQVSEMLRTPEDVRALVTEAAIYREGDEARTAARWRAVKRVALIAGLALAILQYYMMDTLYEIVSAQHAPIFVPVAAPDVRSTLELNAGAGFKTTVAVSDALK